MCAHSFVVPDIEYKYKNNGLRQAEENSESLLILLNYQNSENPIDVIFVLLYDPITPNAWMDTSSYGYITTKPQIFI